MTKNKGVVVGNQMARAEGLFVPCTLQTIVDCRLDDDIKRAGTIVEETSNDIGLSQGALRV
jgi:hypothetical protein